MYQRILKIVCVHLSIILYWGFLFKKNILVKDWPILNAFSTILFITLYGYIYTEISNKNVDDRHSNICLFFSILPIALTMIENVSFKIILLLISLCSTGLFIKKYLIYEKYKNINILPISKSSTQIFTIAVVATSILIIYFFDVESYMMHIFIHLVFLILESFFMLFIKEKEETYEMTYRLYYLSDYMASERNEFARIIHDEIIQDIFASVNYLSLKRPEVDHAKNVLKILETKSRKIMKLYQSGTFEHIDIDASLATIFENIEALFPKKKIEKRIDIKLLENKNEKMIKLISTISKELVNNIYKHSKGTYLTYKISEEENAIIIELKSDGTSSEDYERIRNSKRGVLLLNLLVDSNSGNIKYKLNGDILYTKVYLEEN